VETSSFRARSLALAWLASTAWLGLTAAPAQAQLASPAPVRQSIDENGIDLFYGTVNIDAPALTMGQGSPQGLAFFKLTRGGGWTDNVIATMNLSGSTMTISLGGGADSFTVSGGTYTPTEGNGASLAYNGTTKIYTYTRSDGAVIRFDKNKSTTTPFYANEGRVTDITRPDGSKLVFTYEYLDYCVAWKAGGGGDICTQMGKVYRAASVRNSYGYRLTFAYGYGPDDYSYDEGTPAMQPNFTAYSTVTGVTADNLAVATGASTPSESFVNGTTLEVTDPMGRVTKYRSNGWNMLGITLPGRTTEEISFTLSGGTTGRVTAITTPAGTTSYSASDASGTRTVTVTNALSEATTYTFEIASRLMKSRTDALGRTTSWQHDSSGRVTRVTAPEGNYSAFTYDTRGNVTETRRVAKSGTGLADIVAIASFDSSCTVAVKCNKPNSTTDARGNTTDYTYDSGHGGLLTATLPAATGGAVRPQARISYSSFLAYFKNGAGSIVASGEPVTLPTGSSACQTLASCAGAADEVKTSIGYGPQTTGTGNNLLPVSTSRGNGSGTLTAATAITYDDVGNLLTVDGPLSGAADTIRFRYNADRERIGTVSFDPDGAGALKHRAQRVTIDNRGFVTKVERGTVDSQSDVHWATFSPIEAVETGYDANYRPATSKLTAGGTTYALTQTSYDAVGRPECSAQRMDSSDFAGTLPGACTLTSPTGSQGPDRIVKRIYDAAGQVTQVKAAFGTADEANEVTSTYRSNGQLETVTDAEGNKTTYEYDGHGRLSKRRFPSPAKGAGTSSTTDYEQPGYDANGNVTSFRNRAADATGFAFDALNRMTAKDLPASEPDVAYTYDLLGRMTGASQTGNTLTFTYDALGRNLTQVGPHGTVSSIWDIGGRRTRITHPDAFYVDQEYLVTGEMTVIRENGAASGVGVLATFAYDDLGRRTTLTRGNGTMASYAYDAVSRLASLTDNPAGTTYDQTLGFSYNPASQITQATRSNDLFAWAGHGTGSTSSTANGLNQITVHGGTSTSHDARGNMTADGLGKTFGYSSQNLLTSATGSVTLAYDPMLRLYQVAGVATTRFGYDGADLINEYNASNALQRKFVHGPRLDEPLVWYEGSGTSDRRFLHADERRSISAVSNSSGTVTSVNTYDEYGAPGSGNIGRFQYTGQKWITEIGLYDYKARMYHPKLGRFVQTDPIGYGGGMNLYAYVRADPINYTDSMGTDPLGPLELAYGRSVFDNNIDYSKVDVQFGSVHPIAMAVNSTDRAITIGNTIYFPSNYQDRPDFYAKVLHELTHIYQYQNGYYSIVGLLGIHLAFLGSSEPYNYTISTGSDFDNYNSEAQGQIIEDCAKNISTSCAVLSTSNDGISAPFEDPWNLFVDMVELWHLRGSSCGCSIIVEHELGPDIKDIKGKTG
jgi:RHS repeat-associated protein